MRNRNQLSWQQTRPERHGRVPTSQGVPTKVPTDGRQLIAAVKSFQTESKSNEIDGLDSYCDSEISTTVPRESLHQSDARLALLEESLQQVFQRCRHSNWDGEQEEAISCETFEVARRFIESFPRNSPLPTVTPEPDGQLDFEWYLLPRRLLTVSVSGTGTLYWAALIGSEDPRGSCQFADQFPRTLLYWIRQVFE